MNIDCQIFDQPRPSLDEYNQYFNYFRTVYRENGLVENAGTRICGYADMRICGYADMRVCGYADMRVHRTGLTNRFQKLINNSNKIIAVNTKNHSCEGAFICGKTHVDFHKTLTSIFSAYTTSIY